MIRLFQIALRNLLQHSKRTVLLGGAIAGVTMLLVVLAGLSNGVNATMLESATTLMTGHINIGGFFKVTSGQSAPLVTDYPKVVSLVRQNIPELDFVTERGRGWAKLISDTGSMQVGIGGIDLKDEQGFKRVVKVLSGNLEELNKPGTILIFDEQAKKLDVKVGDTLTISGLSARGSNNTVDVRVAAIADNIGLFSSFNTYVAGQTLRQLYQLSDTATGAIMLYLKDLRDVPKVAEKLRTLLRANGYSVMDPDPNAFWMKMPSINREDWTGQKLDVTTWEDEISFIKRLASSIDALTFVLMTVLLVIISVGIMNTLWIAIRERTREIGTLRAIGMQRGRVLLMFVAEAFSLATASTIAGAILGLVACAALNAAHVPVVQAARLVVMRDTLLFKVNLGTIIGSMALITFCATLISLIPSFIAARMRPVTAMHHVG